VLLLLGVKGLPATDLKVGLCCMVCRKKTTGYDPLVPTMIARKLLLLLLLFGYKYYFSTTTTMRQEEI